MTRRDVIRTATAFLTGRLDAASGPQDFYAPYWNAIVKGYFDHPDPALTPPMLPALAAYAVSGRDRDSDGRLLAQVRDALAKTAINTPALQWTSWILGAKPPETVPGEAFEKAHPGDGSSYWQHAANYLYWREMHGVAKHRFDSRIRELLDLAPQWIAPNGSQPLFGTAIGSRWAWLTALVLGYRQGLWPHSPGLLRAILRRNIDFFWRHGGFDSSAGRLNVKLSDRGTNDFPEPGDSAATPYACMQAFAAVFRIPPQDPFWTVAEERLPSEQRDYLMPIPGSNLLLSNCLETGEVRMHLAAHGRFDSAFRDRYAKFSYSSRFPPCFTQRPQRATWDSALVFHDSRTGTLAARAGITAGRIIDNKGIETDWWTEVRGARIRIVSRIFPEGDRERRIHTITCPASLVSAGGIEVWEGSTALPVAATEPIHTAGEKQKVTASAAGGITGVIAHSGYLADPTIETHFTDTLGTDTINVIAPRSAIVTLRAPVNAASMNLQATFLCHPSFPTGGYK